MSNRKLDVVQYLYPHATGMGRMKAKHAALKCAHMEIILWFEERLKGFHIPGLSDTENLKYLRNSLDGVAAANRVDCLDWMNANYPHGFKSGSSWGHRGLQMPS